ncbi:MAG: preprotein translocase subunit SecE [bacterium]|nr:preprotein translocase subunit SecE [bacterium]
MNEHLLKRIIDALKGSRLSNTKTGDFIVGVLTELDAVTWPTKEEVYNSTVVVLITVVIFAMYSGIWDVVMNFVRQAMMPLYGG